MSSWAVLRVVTMTRGRVRLSTWPLRASVSVTAKTATVTAGQLLTSTPPSCDSMITVAREERSAARLPSTVLPLPWDQRVLPTADPGREAALQLEGNSDYDQFTYDSSCGISYAH